MSVREHLIRWIRSEILFDETASITDETVLCPDVLDSLGIVALVDYLEDDLGILIPETDLVAENFVTLADVCALVARRAPASMGSAPGT